MEGGCSLGCAEFQSPFIQVGRDVHYITLAFSLFTSSLYPHTVGPDHQQIHTVGAGCEASR